MLDSKCYIQSFWDNMKARHQTEFVVQKINSLEELSVAFDIIFLAVGASLIDIWGADLPITLVRGRNLLYDSRKLLEPLNYNACIGDKYIVRRPNSCQLICGSTYEHNVTYDTSQYEGMS